MNERKTEQQLRYLEEVCTYLHRAGFETQPLEDSQLPVYWNGAQLCCITGKGSVFYRREDVGTPQTEEALRQAEDIAARTLEYKQKRLDPFGSSRLVGRQTGSYLMTFSNRNIPSGNCLSSSSAHISGSFGSG